MTTTRWTYPQKCKQETVQCVPTRGKAMAEIERKLGLSKALLKQWLWEAGWEREQAFLDDRRLKTDEERSAAPTAAPGCMPNWWCRGNGATVSA